MFSLYMHASCLNTRPLDGAVLWYTMLVCWFLVMPKGGKDANYPRKLNHSMVSVRSPLSKPTSLQAGICKYKFFHFCNFSSFCFLSLFLLSSTLFALHYIFAFSFFSLGWIIFVSL